VPLLIKSTKVTNQSPLKSGCTRCSGIRCTLCDGMSPVDRAAAPGQNSFSRNNYLEKIVHFAPESIVHFTPESVVHFTPKYSVLRRM